ncbi:MAG: hypothetical protein Q8O46_00715, partial [bacterium]|nr:hypothetical protein [bacterium]
MNNSADEESLEWARPLKRVVRRLGFENRMTNDRNFFWTTVCLVFGSQIISRLLREGGRLAVKIIITRYLKLRDFSKLIVALHFDDAQDLLKWSDYWKRDFQRSKMYGVGSFDRTRLANLSSLNLWRECNLLMSHAFYWSVDAIELEQENTLTTVRFNPLFRLIAFALKSTDDCYSVKVYAFGGLARRENGQKMYEMLIPYSETLCSISWSPSGRFLLILTESQSNSKFGTMRLLKYDRRSSRMRLLCGLEKYSKYITYYSSSNLWMRANSFLLPVEAEDALGESLMLIVLGSKSFRVETKLHNLRIDITSDRKNQKQLENIGSYFVANSQSKGYIGNIFVSSANSRYICYIANCLAGHDHDIIVIFDLKKLLPKGYIAMPHFVAEIQVQGDTFVVGLNNSYSLQTTYEEAPNGRYSGCYSEDFNTCILGPPSRGIVNFQATPSLSLVIFSLDSQGVPNVLETRNAHSGEMLVEVNDWRLNFPNYNAAVYMDQ